MLSLEKIIIHQYRLWWLEMFFSTRSYVKWYMLLHTWAMSIVIVKPTSVFCNFLNIRRTTPNSLILVQKDKWFTNFIKKQNAPDAQMHLGWQNIWEDSIVLLMDKDTYSYQLLERSLVLEYLWWVIHTTNCCFYKEI